MVFRRSACETLTLFVFATSQELLPRNLKLLSFPMAWAALKEQKNTGQEELRQTRPTTTPHCTALCLEFIQKIVKAEDGI